MRARILTALGLLGAAGAAFGLGYRMGGFDRELPPPRSVTSQAAVVPPGVAADVRDVLLEPDALVRTTELGRLFQELGPEDLADVRDAYDSVVLDLGDIELALLAEWWARFDPEGAYAWTREDWRADESAVILMVLRAWARSDPAAALARAQAIPNPNLRNVAIDAALAGWDESGKPGLLEYVEIVPEPWDRQRMAYAVARRKVLRDGAEEALRWAEDLPDDSGKRKLYLFQRVAGAAAEVDPRAAAAFAERHAGGDFGAGLYRRVGTRWVERDPEAAFRWLATLPEDDERAAAVRESYRTWLRLDRAGAHAWLPAQKLEPWLDPAVSIYAQSLAVEDPGRGVAWAMKISDEQHRWSTVVIVGRWWLLSDEPAARAWIAQAGLPDLYHRKVFEFPRGLLKRAGRAGNPPAPPSAPAAGGPEAPEAPEG